MAGLTKMILSDNINIREAILKDISGITKVLDGTLRQDFVYGKRSFEENVYYCFSKSLEHKHEGVYVAELDEEIVGFSWFMNHPPNNGTSILEMFAVRKDRQKQGIGSKLIKKSSDMFVESQKRLGCDLRTLHLTTNFSNEGAQRIYKRAGYYIAGEIGGFVGEGNVEEVMLKKVSNVPAPKEYITKL